MSRAQSAPLVEPDVQFQNVGSFAMATPTSVAGRRWVARHVARESVWVAGSVPVEFRYLEDLVLAMRGAGLVVEALR